MFFDLIRKRRSIRKFTDQKVEPEKVELIVEAALRSPSSRGRQPWEIHMVQDAALSATLANSKRHGSAFLSGAPLLIVVCADPEVSDVWIEDTSIVATYVQLAAEELGLGSTWVQLRLRQQDDATTSEQWVKSVLELHHGLQVTCIIGIGYPAEQLQPWPISALPTAKVHYYP